MPKLECFSSYLQLSLCNIFKPSVKWRMKMQLEKPRQAMLQLHLSDQQSIAYYNATYIRNLTVSLFIILPIYNIYIAIIRYYGYQQAQCWPHLVMTPGISIYSWVIRSTVETASIWHLSISGIYLWVQEVICWLVLLIVIELLPPESC